MGGSDGESKAFSRRNRATQLEILEIGKQAWLEKMHQRQLIRKMSGVVAIGMSCMATCASGVTTLE